MDGLTQASPFLAALPSLTASLIAAVNGDAIGVGTTMLAHADIVVGARSARFATPFTSLGPVPEAASSRLFLRLVERRRRQCASARRSESRIFPSFPEGIDPLNAYTPAETQPWWFRTPNKIAAVCRTPQ
jgi:Enoyl-CoA hydratase/isomerase